MSQLYEVWTTKSPEFRVATATLGGISLVGLVGNGLVVAIILLVRMRGSKSSVQLFLLHLAISDLLVCLVCIPLTVYSNFNYPMSNNSKQNILCKFSRFAQFLAPTISISLLATISIDRFYTIARPMLSKAPRPQLLRPRWILTIAWAYSIILFIPTFYFASLQPLNTTNYQTVYYCTPIPNQRTDGFVFLIIVFIGSFVLPLGTMTVLYSRVVRVVWSREKDLFLTSNACASITSSLLERSRKRVLFMLLIVVSVFLACWSPFVIYSGFVEPRIKRFPNPMDGIRIILYCLGLSNSICNPFIYFFFTRGFSFESIKTLFSDSTITKRRSCIILISPRTLEMEVRKNEMFKKVSLAAASGQSPLFSDPSPNVKLQENIITSVRCSPSGNTNETKTSTNPILKRETAGLRESTDTQSISKEGQKNLKWSNDENGVWTLCEDTIRSDTEEYSTVDKNGKSTVHGTGCQEEDSSPIYHNTSQENDITSQSSKHVQSKSSNEQSLLRKLHGWLFADNVPETKV